MNKDKSSEIFPRLLLKPHYRYAHVLCREPKKGQQKVQILKKTTGHCPSRSYYSENTKLLYLEPYAGHVVHAQLHLRHAGQEGEEEHAHAAHVLRHVPVVRLLHIHLVHGGQLDLLRLVGEGPIAMHVDEEEPLLDADGELFHVLVADAGELEQLGYLGRVLQGYAQLLHVARKLFHTLESKQG